MKKILHSPFFIRLLHWEYWPFHAVYAPIYIYWLWLCLKARSFFFFSTSNPSLKNGGFLMESKKEIYDLLPEGYYPKTLFFSKRTSVAMVRNEIERTNLKFPLIGKPDIGMRGMAVKKLNDYNELADYINLSKVDFLIQEHISFEKEAGIFYYRFPNKTKGTISGIVYKEFLSVEGNGRSSIQELLQKDKRSLLQLDTLLKTDKTGLNKVLPEGCKEIIVPYGNHSRGAKFIDASDQIDRELINVIDRVCRQIEGFYYGRLDIRFTSWEELKEGRNFSIIELNGAGSEPTHIYDPGHSLFFAWKEIIKHWQILYKISKLNRGQNAYMNFSSGIKMFRENYSYIKLLNEDQRA